MLKRHGRSHLVLTTQSDADRAAALDAIAMELTAQGWRRVPGPDPTEVDCWAFIDPKTRDWKMGIFPVIVIKEREQAGQYDIYANGPRADRALQSLLNTIRIRMNVEAAKRSANHERR